jgi:hypothetical protein
LWGGRAGGASKQSFIIVVAVSVVREHFYSQNTLAGLRYCQFWQRHNIILNVHYAVMLPELVIFLLKGSKSLRKEAGGGGRGVKIGGGGNGAFVSQWSIALNCKFLFCVPTNNKNKKIFGGRGPTATGPPTGIGDLLSDVLQEATHYWIDGKGEEEKV